MRPTNLTYFLPFFLFFAATAVESPATASPLRIYYTSNRQGEVEPCDCRTHQNGGLNRLQAFLDAQRAESGSAALFVDAGDTFFSLPSIPASRVESERARSELIARTYARLGLDFLTPGDNDFALGTPALLSLGEKAGTKLLAANLESSDAKTKFDSFRMKSVGGVEIAVIGVVGPEAFSRVAEVRVSDPEAALRGAVEAAKTRGAKFVLVLSHAGLAVDRKLAAVDGVDAIVGAHSLDALGEPVRVGRAVIVQPMFQGQQVGILDFDLEKKDVVSRVVDLDESWDKDNETKTQMRDYVSRVRAIAVAQTPGATTDGVRPFVANSQVCRGCHAKQYDFWNTTKHASAYMVLYAKNQHFDPECIACHSVGFEDPAGFQNIASPIVIDGAPKRKKGEIPFVEKMMKTVFQGDKAGPLDSRTQPARYAKLKKRYHEEVDKLVDTGKLKAFYIGVQCENCHGNRNGHPSPNVPTVKKVFEGTCRSCHDAQHHPEFDFKMVKQVACPLLSDSKSR